MQRERCFTVQCVNELIYASARILHIDNIRQLNCIFCLTIVDGLVIL